MSKLRKTFDFPQFCKLYPFEKSNEKKYNRLKLQLLKTKHIAYRA